MLTAMLISVAEGVHAGTWYRWTDLNGHIHYGDMPVPGAQEINFSNPPELLGANLPYATRRAMMDFPVELYVVEECGESCDKARELLNERVIPFAEQVLKTREEFDALKLRSGGGGIHALSIGKTWIAGFKPSQWHAELDAAGYPGIPGRTERSGNK